MPDVALEYEHECNPPPVNILAPERHKWYCPDCGTGWRFAARKMEGRTVARWFAMVMSEHVLTVGVPTAKLRQVADRWDEEAREFYYANRHTHPQGIGYAAGFEEGLEHAAELLRAELG